MPANDGFDPDHHLPLFLSERADEPDQQDIRKAWDRAVVSSRILKTGILVVTAAAIGSAILWGGNPVRLFADVKASLVDISPLQPRNDRSTPTIQSTADARALPPTARDAPPSDEIAAAAEPADHGRNKIRQPSGEALLKQFQAWAAEEDARAQARPVQDAAAAARPVQPVQESPTQVRPVQAAQEAPAQVAEEAQAPVRHVHRHRKLRLLQNARAEIRPMRNPRARVRREQNAQVQVRSVQDARSQDRSVPNAQAPSFLQSLGLQHQ